MATTPDGHMIATTDIGTIIEITLGNGPVYKNDETKDVRVQKRMLLRARPLKIEEAMQAPDDHYQNLLCPTPYLSGAAKSQKRRPRSSSVTLDFVPAAQ
jgi:hypothetical protein